MRNLQKCTVNYRTFMVNRGAGGLRAMAALSTSSAGSLAKLRKDPDAHNTLVTSWNPDTSTAWQSREKRRRFSICHNMYQVNIKHGKVSLQLYRAAAG